MSAQQHFMASGGGFVIFQAARFTSTTHGYSDVVGGSILDGQEFIKGRRVREIFSDTTFDLLRITIEGGAGTYPVSMFDQISIPGYPVFYTRNALAVFPSGGDTTWQWDLSGPPLVSGNAYTCAWS